MSSPRYSRYAFAVSVLLILCVAYVFHPTRENDSTEYSLAWHALTIVTGIAGLWLFRKLLLIYYSDTTTAIVLLMLTAGTCFLNYTAIDTSLTHTVLFTIYTLLLLNTQYYYSKPARKYAIRMGLLCGLAILVRPSEIVAIVIPLLWGMQSLSIQELRRQSVFLKQHANHMLLAALFVVLAGTLHLVYCYYVTGNPPWHSYNSKDFSWTAPHWRLYLTGPTSGWIMYNPMVLFILLGIPVFLKYGRNKVAVLTFFLLTLYTLTAWNGWWYPGVAGRDMMQGFPITMLITAVFIEKIREKKLWIYIALPFILLFMYISLWIHYHAHRPTRLYDSINMSSKYYWSVIGRWGVDTEKIKLQDANDIYTGPLTDSVLVYENEFDDSNSGGSLMLQPHANSGIYTVTNIPAGKEWIRIQCTYRQQVQERDYWAMFRTQLRIKQGDKEIKGEEYRPQHFLHAAEPGVVYYDIRIPAAPFDKIEISFLNEYSNQVMIVDDVKIWMYNGE